MQGKYQASKRLNAPRMSEDYLRIGDIHAKLVTEALFDVVGYLL